MRHRKTILEGHGAMQRQLESTAFQEGMLPLSRVTDSMWLSTVAL